MTLSKQLIILILALFFMIFSVNFIISVNNMRSYLQVESQVHAQDTATSLGLSLSPYIKDENDPVLRTMMNAIFDRGYYKEMLLVNAEQKPLIRLVNDQRFHEVPQWFIELFPIRTAKVESEISSGWNLGGIIYVTINSGYAYLKLYEQAKSSLWYSTWTFFIAVLLLLFVLRFVLLPLKKINALALSIAHGQFDTIEKLPWTTEVRNVASSMNTMSVKIAKMIRSLNAKIEALGNKLQLDDLTGLHKRSSFETEMNQLFLENTEAYIFLVKLDSLGGLVKERSPEVIDEFIRDAANTLKQTTQMFAQGRAAIYHLFSAEFAIVVRSSNYQQVEQYAKSVSQVLAELGTRYQIIDVAHFGVAPFNLLSTTAGILAAANEAFEQARLISANGYYIRTGIDQAKDIAQWKALVFEVVNNDSYEVIAVNPIQDIASGELLMEEAFIQINDTEQNRVSIGTFISIAEKFEKIVDLDKGVVQKIINLLAADKMAHPVAVNISTRTVKNNEFRHWLSFQMENRPHLARKLVFGMSAYAVAKEFKVYKEFVEFVHSLGAKVLLKRFDTQSMSVDAAKRLRPDYLRLARDLSNGLAHDHSKVAFVEAMKDIGELLDIQILAENVVNEDDFTLMKAIGISGVSR